VRFVDPSTAPDSSLYLARSCRHSVAKPPAVMVTTLVVCEVKSEPVKFLRGIIRKSPRAVKLSVALAIEDSLAVTATDTSVAELP